MDNAAPKATVRLASETWESLMTAHASLNRLFSNDNIWKNASMKEYDVLYTLAKAAGPLRICDLQERVLLSQPALSRLVDRLIDRSLIERTVDLEDRRAVRIFITEAGLELQKEVGRVHAKSIFKELNPALDPEEQIELLRLCEKLSTYSKTRTDR